jgi:tRNA nucleotidyltransferase (CCA-adding enzyme)
MHNSPMDQFVGHWEVSAFADEVVNLKRDDVEEFRKQVRTLRERLEGYISEHPDYSLVKMLHSGSVAKGTALRTLNDMDVAVYIKKTAAPSDEAQLLSWLKERLREVYPTMKEDQFVLQSHCVTISYRGSGLDVDVVPILYEGAKDDRGFLIVKDTGERVETSIPLHLEFIRKRKEANKHNYRQIVRLIKWWARAQKNNDSDFRFKSFVAELLCAHLADRGTPLEDYPLALERVFAYIVRSGLRERISFDDYYSKNSLPKESTGPLEIFDPVNPQNNVTARYTDSLREKIVGAAQDALDAINEAHYATTKGRALEMWKVVFGPAFRIA